MIHWTTVSAGLKLNTELSKREREEDPKNSILGFRDSGKGTYESAPRGGHKKAVKSNEGGGFGW